MKDSGEGRKLSATSKGADGKGDGREEERKKDRKEREGRWEIQNPKIEALRQPVEPSYVFRQEGYLIKAAGTILPIDYGHGPSGQSYGILSSTWN